MTEDWAAVSRAIIGRMAELPMKQHDVVARSGVSRAIVREIQYNTVQRNRGERTLAALSEALRWHSGHLDAVLHGQVPPRGDAPSAGSTKDIPGRLSAIEYELRRIQDRLERIDSANDRRDDLAADIKAGVDRIIARLPSVE